MRGSLPDPATCTAAVNSPERPLTGRILAGRYLIGQRLGSGAMGCVYQARHLELGRICAVKVIRQELDAEEERETSPCPDDAVARFRIEALAASRLDHPNVLRVLDYGCEPEDNLWFLVTEHLDGEDLADLMAAEGPLSTDVSAGILQQVCAALQHAHGRGVIHRDIKPRNVRIVRREGDDGQVEARVKLLDFGTAMLLSGPGTQPTSDQILLGTPAYMSPEQASGQVLDGRSDLYACGVMLFEMVTGRLPFERSCPLALAAAHVSATPPPPRSIQDTVDADLEDIILRCLRKNPAHRPQNARELWELLGRLLVRPAPPHPGGGLSVSTAHTGPRHMECIPSHRT
jgi:eukaryotic-like serine/threonine-protein kinase